MDEINSQKEFQYGEICYNYYYRYRDENNFYRYRQGSVPHTGKRRSGYRYHHNPPHRYEETNKWIAGEDEESILTPIQINKLEKYRWVPDPWDDRPRYFYGHNWKRHRKTQYKICSI